MRIDGSVLGAFVAYSCDGSPPQMSQVCLECHTGSNLVLGKSSVILERRTKLGFARTKALPRETEMALAFLLIRHSHCRLKETKEYD